MASSITIGVPAETKKGELRVAICPDDAAKLGTSGFSVLIEKGAGARAGFDDTQYNQLENVELCSKAKAWKADLVVRVQPPSVREAGLMREKATLICHVFPSTNPLEVAAMAKHKVTCLAMELIPRITKAQAMDSLSSQATISGYWSVLHAASIAPFFFPMITYAAGTIRPAKILVIGAGVAGLQAIATARRLGAIVEAFDVRPETREQIASLGAKPVDLGFDASGEGGYARTLTAQEREQVASVLTATLKKTNLVITTAGLPGKPAPQIIRQSQVESMAPGSVIVDAMAESGGNCELTQAGQTIVHAGVTISGPLDIPSRLALHASQMYSKNLMGMLALIIQNHAVVIDPEDEIVQGCLLLDAGKAVHESMPRVPSTKPTSSKKTTKSSKARSRTTKAKPSTRSAAATTKSKTTSPAARNTTR